MVVWTRQWGQESVLGVSSLRSRQEVLHVFGTLDMHRPSGRMARLIPAEEEREGEKWRVGKELII